MKLLIVAHSPGTTGPYKRALDGSSSLRNLARYAALDDPEEVYRRASVVNLIERYIGENWPSREAQRRVAEVIMDAKRERMTHIVGLSVNVRIAFCQVLSIPRPEWFDWREAYGLAFAFSPHPSGLSRAWNDATTRARGSAFWHDALGKAPDALPFT